MRFSYSIEIGHLKNLQYIIQCMRFSTFSVDFWKVFSEKITIIVKVIIHLESVPKTDLIHIYIYIHIYSEYQN